ncbi:glycoside hydrolase family 7 protein [Macrolepiota fuliginosa MF-IS2]|uniref:Glucanase n=1 Tax=Macrolepiota fuliginosa MF-IS2 TaxID=1400762 RepID=A0A9P5XBU2_9AGAR|nr:glycoside hydrolase family 7 protein [Macrolepiota fuliginosa MF-IS2]
MFPGVLLALYLTAVSLGQQAGTILPESHPTLTWQKVTLDSHWRWIHSASDYTNCYTGNTWNVSICPDPQACATNCALDGADYSGTYGILTSGGALTLKFITNPTNGQTNIGSRVYLLADDAHYEMFKLLNREFFFDVDVSSLPCGPNGALYFSEMEVDGGMAANLSNRAGAKYGTGYCDSQCTRDLKFINGEANVLGWTASAHDPGAGAGNWSACYNELDVWEANSISTTYIPHPCTNTGLHRCSGTECGTEDRYSTVCDPDGCDFNPFRMGDKTFYGNGLTLDTSRKFTVVTQFFTSDNSTSGLLSEIRRLYVQDGKVITNSQVNVPGMSTSDSITSEYCTAQKAFFGDVGQFGSRGGITGVSAAMARGMVLVFSVRNDYTNNMFWLDSNYPTDADPSKPGVTRGTCAPNVVMPYPVDVPENVNAHVTFSNIKFGEIGSTYYSDST